MGEMWDNPQVDNVQLKKNAAAANAAVAIQRCRFGVLLATVGKQRCAQFAAEKLLVGAKWVCANGWVLYSVMKGLASKK